jgi:hypothetical protein
MIPEYQTWRNTKDEEVRLEKNHGSGDCGYYVDVRGSREVLDTLKKRLDEHNQAKCQWNSEVLPKQGRLLTVREVSQNFQGNAILGLIGTELTNLGYSKMAM